MKDDDALRDEMPRLGRHLDRDPLALDQGTAERLLAGTLDPADAPPAYAAVAEVLAAAGAPPRPDELAGEAEAVARFRAHAARRPVRTGRQLARLAVTAAVVLGLLSAAGVGFATGVIPRTGEWVGRAVQSVVGTEPGSNAPPGTEPGSSSTSPAGQSGSTAASTTPGSVQSPSSSAVPGSTAAAEGLCRAYQAGNGKKLDAAAFQALATAAGGSDNIPAYCRAVQEAQGGPSKPGKGHDGGGTGQGQGGGVTGQGGSGQSTPAVGGPNAPATAGESQSTPAAGGPSPSTPAAAAPGTKGGAPS